MKQQIVFISIDGMTDPLGQSQVLPYLTSLAKKEFAIRIVSCEKIENFRKNESIVSEIISKHNIKWEYCFYKSNIPLLSQRGNFQNLKYLVENEIQNNKNIILHCRSYLASLIGLKLKKKYGVKFIFDMRGFWADERIEGKIWNLKNPVHKLIYSYFKRKEKAMLAAADHIVTLTSEAITIINKWSGQKKASIEVIPCCVDTNHFMLKTEEQKNNIKYELGIDINSFVVGYLGSIGTWYMLDEMLDYFVELKKVKKNAVLFFVTPDHESQIRKVAEIKNIQRSDLIIKPAKRDEVPAFISTFDVGLFFIRPTFSKKGSSPTKLAELLACGIPIITNSGLGDCDSIITENKCGILIKEFSSTAYKNSIAQLDILLAKTPEFFRKVSLTNFSLEKGVESYEKIYLSLAGEVK